MVFYVWLAQTLRVSATVVHSSFHCLWQPETDFIFPEDPGPTYRPQLHLSPVLSLLSFFSTQSNSKPPNIFERERGYYALAPAKKTVTRPRARSESRVRVAASRVTIHIISKSCLKDQSDLVLTYLVSTWCWHCLIVRQYIYNMYVLHILIRRRADVLVLLNSIK